MYMRLVQARYKPDSLSEIHKIYEGSIIPRLQTIPGCLCACLIRSDLTKDEGISLTLWDSREHAENYEKNGIFKELLDKVRPHLSGSSEWKMELSKDLILEYKPVPDEPVVTTYVALAQAERKLPSHDETSSLYLRILSIKVKPGKMHEFRKIYVDEIIPALHGVKGCRYAFLTENTREENEGISVTLWDSKEDADAYERNRIFHSLVRKVEHIFAEVYQWKAILENKYSGRVITSEDPKLRTYEVVTGRNFQ